MIDRKYQKIVFAFFMAPLISCIISLVINIFNVGLVSNIHIWLKAWLFAFIVAFPTITAVAPLAQNWRAWCFNRVYRLKHRKQIVCFACQRTVIIDAILYYREYIYACLRRW
ncbi:MAG: DUF2798 domain-containing protein [Pedobacter sp.]|nr:MAG: DUF2798 domain-containing protein [Pedobacter sp.]